MRPRRALMVALVAVFAAGGGAPTPAPPPSAKEVLAKPQKSNLTDAHFAVTGKITNNGVTLVLVGDGALVYKPKPAGRFKYSTSVGGQTLTVEERSLDGTNYGLTPTSSKWVAQKSATGGIDPNAFTGASELKYVGEETLPQGKAWHASAKDKDGNAFDAYIRESDGFPMKYVETQSGGQNITLSFDNYNTGETIKAPPPDQIQSG